MRAHDFQECVLLEACFAGPADQILPDDALQGLLIRIAPRWWERAGCLGCDTDAWFPTPTARPEPLVERVCARCPVRKSCLASAVLGDEEGIWGGTRRGQRLHARARLLNGDGLGDVLADLLHSPLARTEYAIPDPIPAATADAASADEAVWKEAS